MIETAIAFFGLALSAFFSGTEIAFLQANPLQLKVWSKRGSQAASRTEIYMEEPERYLTTVLVGTNLANVLTSSYGAIVLTRLELPQFFILLIIGSIILFFGEVLPKSFAREWASSIAVLATPFLKTSEFLLSPLVRIAHGYALLFPESKPKKHPDFMSREELKILFDKVGMGKDLEAEGKKVITNIFEFGSRSVQTAMTPRVDIIGLKESASVESAIKLMVSTGLSKLVLFKDSINEISGVIFLHDLISGEGPLSELARRPLFISESLPASEALRELRRYRSTIAMVVAENGKTSGLVTVEDLIEELFGEFEDVFDEEKNRVSRLVDNSLVMDGRMNLDELKVEYGITLPPGNYETIGGFIIDHLGRIPSAGEKLDTEGTKIRILKSTPSQIERVHLRSQKP